MKSDKLHSLLVLVRLAGTSTSLSTFGSTVGVRAVTGIVPRFTTVETDYLASCGEGNPIGSGGTASSDVALSTL
jgi:hypothetical protein